jgi:hypothetical protein
MAVLPVLGGTTLPNVSAYTEDIDYYGGNVVTASGSVSWQLVDTTARRSFVLTWTALVEGSVSVVEAGLDTINNGTASFTSPRNATYTVTRSPEATGIAWVWFTDGAGNLRADGSLTLREAPA